MEAEQCVMYENCVEIFGIYGDIDYMFLKMCDECSIKNKLQEIQNEQSE
jgi:hypothetical protein